VGEVREGVTEEAGVTSSEPAPAESVVGKKSDKGAGDPSASPRGAIMSSVFAIAPKTLKVPSDFTSLLSFLTLIFGPGTRGVGLGGRGGRSKDRSAWPDWEVSKRRFADTGVVALLMVVVDEGAAVAAAATTAATSVGSAC